MWMYVLLIGMERDLSDKIFEREDDEHFLLKVIDCHKRTSKHFFVDVLEH